jgi:hypothetical protein
MHNTKVNTTQDTGWGVIYRLNGLFAEVEELCAAGKYDEWNIKLDRIWSNLLYRNPLEFVENNNGDITNVNFSDEDIKKKDFIDKQILKAKYNMSQAKKDLEDSHKVNKEYISAKSKLYKALLMKEIWLRKFMFELGLYLKELEYNPAGAMWGK